MARRKPAGQRPKRSGNTKVRGAAKRPRASGGGVTEGGSEARAIGQKVLRTALPAVRRRAGEGLGAVAAVAEGVAGNWDLVCAVQNHTQAGGGLAGM